MQYNVVNFIVDNNEDFVADLFIDQLAQIGFDSFENTAEGIAAYVPSADFNLPTINQLIADFPYKGISIADYKTLEDIDWNSEWEKNYFQPIVIDGQCVIHSTFHTDLPQLPYDIIINPQMAFGTGHHQTTTMMLKAILANDFTGKTVLDMGCGTAVLAILAHMRGAAHVTAIDIDDWCTRNADENARLNHINDIEIIQGDANSLQSRYFDIILANINRNILLNDMSQYVKSLNAAGQLFISGFYSEDIPILTECANNLNLKLVDQLQIDNWTMLHFAKL